MVSAASHARRRQRRWNGPFGGRDNARWGMENGAGADGEGSVPAKEVEGGGGGGGRGGLLVSVFPMLLGQGRGF